LTACLTVGRDLLDEQDFSSHNGGKAASILFIL
jgi:hypothetical protein